MEIKFVPVDFEPFDFEGKNYIKLVGRTDKGKKICVVDSYEPNFYVVLKSGAGKKAEKIAEKISQVSVEKANRESKVVKTKICDKKFLGEDVKAIRVYVTNHKDAHDIASEIGEMDEIEARREYDISLTTKYIKEKNILPLHWYTVKGSLLGAQDFGGLVDSIDLEICLAAESFKELKNGKEFVPKVLAYDIETDKTELGKGEILMIGVYGNGIKKVFSCKKCSASQDYVECYKDEGEMIEAFVEAVRKYDPDILTGYFSDGFDLPYLKASSEKNKIKLNLGIDGREPTFTRGRIPSGKISGIVHVDIYRFVKNVFSQYLQSETLSLNEVSKELVGESKENFDFNKLPHMTDKDWKDFFSYNIQDAIVTYKLFHKIWPDILEFCKIVKEPLFDLTRNSMSSLVENYLIHNLDRFDEIAEKRPMNDEIGRRRAMGKYEGAFVYEPEPGLYENIVMFDFTSMYASVIVTYNLSKSTFISGDKFSKSPGFFPVMLGEIIDKRKKHKREFAKNSSGILRARSNAYKLLANASYGYQAFFGARYYCREAAASTARLARDNIKSAIEKIKREDHKVIYGDTDSIAFLRGKKSKNDILKFLKEINDDLPGIMELDLEGFFKRGIFVAARGVEKGAKKKYALIDEKGNVKIRGFETVRRDWCRLTRELQSDILKVILEDGDSGRALKLFSEVISKLKNREIELDKLLIRTQLRQPINEYLSEGPHVIAAKKMVEEGISVNPGMLIEYFVGEINGKGKRIGDKVYLPDEKAKYDIEYYLNHQIIPAVENIFDVFGVRVKEVVDGESQKTLF
ncbi:MAG: DNA-directed DNA polymerase [archaeon]